DTVVDTTQTLGGATGLGQPVDGLLQQVGNTVGGLGENVSGLGLPGGLSEGVGGLVSGVGATVGSVGAVLNPNADTPNPLGNTLGLATGAVGSLTQGLADGGLLAPLDGLLSALPEGGNAVLEPALGNTGAAVNNLVPLGLEGPLASVGATLDPVVSPVTD